MSKKSRNHKVEIIISSSGLRVVDADGRTLANVTARTSRAKDRAKFAAFRVTHNFTGKVIDIDISPRVIGVRPNQ